MTSLKEKCDIAYEMGEPIMTDAEYDATFGDGASSMQTDDVLKDVVPLPVWMGSLDKVRTEKSLDSFLKRLYQAPEFVVSCKLDGISALYDPVQKKLYTRGNGRMGMDITRFLKFINIDTSHMPTDRHSFVRGELIMPKKVFERKYKETFKNPRNLVAGQFSRKEMNKNILKDVYFVPYELIDSRKKSTQSLPSKQFETLSSDNFLWETILRSDVTIANLTDILEMWEKVSIFAIDGLVLAVNLPYVRSDGENPKNAVAFKRETDTIQRETTVTGVEWNVSKWGVLVPTVLVEPVEISGVTISKLTGHNAKYILDKGIGPGAKIVCVRSGDVIPYILSVVEESPHAIELPSSTWDGVNLMAEDEDDDTVEIKTLTNLFVGLGVKDVSLKTFEKMYEDCNLTTFPEMLNCTKRDLAGVFGDKTSEKILDRMYELKSKPIEVSKIVGYSGVLGYGLGVRKVEKLLEDLGDISKIPSRNRVMQVEGFSEKTAEKVVENYPMMLKFLDLCVANGLRFAGKKKKNPNALKVCMTGFRDKSLEDECISSSSVTKDCDYLVCKDKTKESGKTKRAKQLGVKIVSKDEFERILRR
jgi:DNA ligase (NAD+)